MKLMIAGLSHHTWVLRGDPAEKRIIGTPKTLTPEDAANPAFDLRALAKR